MGRDPQILAQAIDLHHWPFIDHRAFDDVAVKRDFNDLDRILLCVLLAHLFLPLHPKRGAPHPTSHLSTQTALWRDPLRQPAACTFLPLRTILSLLTWRLGLGEGGA